MRNTFALTVTELAETESDLVLLSGDIGNRLFDDFKERFEDRFYNCGVAEAGMTGLASGLASCGLRPITYTITPFNTLRCLEQIRVDICYPNLPVTIVGTGAGLSYANLGSTHHSMEDIGVLRLLPNMNVVCPGDTIEVDLALRGAMRMKNPTYIRLGKKGEPRVHQGIPDFSIGKAITIVEGSDIAIIGVGNMLPVAADCGAMLRSEGISTGVSSLHTVKPLDEDFLRKIFDECSTVVVLEEHGLAGGAGSAILEWGCVNKVDLNKLTCFGGPDEFLSACGNQREAREAIGLEANVITSQLLKQQK